LVDQLGCGLRELVVGIRLSIEEREFLFTMAFIPALGAIKPPILRVPGFLHWGCSDRDVKIITHLHLLPRLRMTELYLHSPIRLLGVDLNYVRDNNAITFYTFKVTVFSTE
jgi:hypothetical protein